MILFCCDLDNTLIYSYKHDIGENTIPVELYEGRQISFMTEKSHKLLTEVVNLVNFVPTTTRSLAQYQRIDLKIPTPTYALVANGGILLVDGAIDEEWFETSKNIVKSCEETMNQGFSLLEKDKFVVEEQFQTRWVDDLFLFTKSSNPEATVQSLSKVLDLKQVSLHTNGAKVYIVPHTLTKGDALCRLKERLNHKEITLSAGDSAFDLPMLHKADYKFAPSSLVDREELDDKWFVAEENVLFSEYLLLKIKEDAKIL